MTMIDTERKRLGLYLHVPFCLRKCHYCDFHSAPASSAAREVYVRSLAAHLEQKAEVAQDYLVDTVYIGGGTPTLLSVDQIASILNTVRRCYRLASDVEITVECNPVTHAENLFEGLAAAGVNRLSIGLQSAHDAELIALGRPHDYGDFEKTYRAARAAGLSNLNVDLMFGIPGQSLSSFRETLDRVVALAPEHISAYGLRIEEGTRFFDTVHTLSLPSEDEVADMQELAAGLLGKAGYEHYEISNYARSGCRSRHNLRYWLSSPYLGFGPGAHSYFEDLRFSAPRHTAAYITAVEQGDWAVLEAESHRVEGKELQDEYVMLRMRLSEGIDEADFASRFGLTFEEAYGNTDRLVEGGFLLRRGGRLVFTERGMYVSNAILSDWLDFGTEEH